MSKYYDLKKLPFMIDENNQQVIAKDLNDLEKAWNILSEYYTKEMQNELRKTNKTFELKEEVSGLLGKIEEISSLNDMLNRNMIYKEPCETSEERTHDRQHKKQVLLKSIENIDRHIKIFDDVVERERKLWKTMTQEIGRKYKWKMKNSKIIITLDNKNNTLELTGSMNLLIPDKFKKIIWKCKIYYKSLGITEVATLPRKIAETDSLIDKIEIYSSIVREKQLCGVYENNRLIIEISHCYEEEDRNKHSTKVLNVLNVLRKKISDISLPEEASISSVLNNEILKEIDLHFVEMFVEERAKNAQKIEIGDCRFFIDGDDIYKIAYNTDTMVYDLYKNCVLMDIV